MLGFVFDDDHVVDGGDHDDDDDKLTCLCIARMNGGSYTSVIILMTIRPK